MIGARCTAMAVLLVLLHGCGQPTCGTCISYGVATFRLSCNTTDLTSVMVDGPCAPLDAGLSSSMPTNGLLELSSSAPGTCHVQLTFASGFTYSADATFGWLNAADCGGCPDFIGPTNGPFIVNNPPETCVMADGGTAASLNGS